MLTIRSRFSGRLITPNFPAVQIVIHQFFTWIALVDVDLCSSLNANVVEEETK